MFGLDISIAGLLVMGVTALVSFWIGRTLSRGWRERRRNAQEAKARAAESRQTRRARERREKGR